MAEQDLLKSGTALCGDTLGPFPESKGGNTTLFYYQDFKIRYAWYKPGGACNSENAWAEFKSFARETKVPLTFDGESITQSCTFWSDGGSEYKKVFADRCKYFGIDAKVFPRYNYGRMLGESSNETVLRLMHNNWKSGEINFTECGFTFSDVWDHIAVQSCVQMNLLPHPIKPGITRHESMTGIALTADELNFLVPVPPGTWATVYNPPSARKGKGKLYGKQMLGLFLCTDINHRVWHVIVPGRRGVFRSTDVKFDVNLDHIPPMICDADYPIDGVSVIDELKSAVRQSVPPAEWGNNDDDEESDDSCESKWNSESGSDDNTTLPWEDDEVDGDDEKIKLPWDTDSEVSSVDEEEIVIDAGDQSDINLEKPWEPDSSVDEEILTIEEGTGKEDNWRVMEDESDSSDDGNGNGDGDESYQLDEDTVIINYTVQSSIETIFGFVPTMSHDMECISDVVNVWQSITMDPGSEWVIASDVPIPRDYPHSQTMSNAKEWEEATNYEYEQMAKQSVYNLMTLSEAQELLPGKKPITSKLVFVVKPDVHGGILKYRVRMCVQGFKMKKGVDYFETFAAIPRMSSWRILMAIAVENQMYTKHIDVSSAFLHAKLDKEDWYIMRLPIGRRQRGKPKHLGTKLYGDREEELYAVVTKGLYGTPPAPRAWSKHCDEVTESTPIDFEKSHYDPCIYIGKTQDGETVYLLRWVDDIIICADSESAAYEFITSFSEQLPVTVEDLKLYLGGHFEGSTMDGCIKVTQTSLIEKGAKAVGLVPGETKPVGAPMEAGDVLKSIDCPTTEKEKNEAKKFHGLYRTGVGILLWITGMTRPDCAFAASQLSKFVSNPGAKHYKCLQRVFRYLLGTKGEGLEFHRGNVNNIDMSVPFTHRNTAVSGSDATYGSEEDGSFTFGILVIINGTPTVWRAKKWTRPILSSFHSETISASELCREVEYVRGLMGELGHPQHEPTVNYCDNTGTISHTRERKSTERSKHINVRDFYVRDCESRGVVRIVKAHTSNIVVDGLTKSITAMGIKRMRPCMLGRYANEDSTRDVT
jgi:hypothetical protein